MTTASTLRHPLWATLRARRDPVSIPELARAIGATDAMIAWRLSRWAAAGFVQSIKPGNDDAASQRTRYLMVDASRRLPAPPSLNRAGHPSAARGGRQAMWRVIRIKRRFDLVELHYAAGVSEASARQFVSILLRAGILRRERRGHAATGQRSIYALVADPGPRPPVVRQVTEGGQRTTHLFDPNSGRSHPLAAARRAPLF